MSVVRFHLRAPYAKRCELGEVESNHRPSVDSTFSEAHDCGSNHMAPYAKRCKPGEVESNHRPSVDSTFSEAHDCGSNHMAPYAKRCKPGEVESNHQPSVALAKRMIAEAIIWRHMLNTYLLAWLNGRAADL